MPVGVRAPNDNAVAAQASSQTGEASEVLVELVVFRHLEIGFCVLKVEARGRRETVTIVVARGHGDGQTNGWPRKASRSIRVPRLREKPGVASD